MRILVTGGIGYIGSELIRRIVLNPAVESVTILDNCSSQRYASLFHLPCTKPYRFIEGDILKGEDLDLALRGINAVVHLAGITNAPQTYNIADEVQKVNYDGTKQLIQTCVERGVRQFIFASTTSIYGPVPGVAREDRAECDLLPQSPYATSKLAAEKEVLDASRDGDFSGVCLRFGSVFGPSPGMRFHTFLNNTIWRAVTGKPVTVMSAFMELTRPFLALQDAVNAVEFVLDRPDLGSEIYNVVTLNVKLGQIISEIQKNAPEMEINYTDERVLNQISYYVDDSKLKKTGFYYQGDLGANVRQTFNMLGALHPSLTSRSS